MRITDALTKSGAGTSGNSATGGTARRVLLVGLGKRTRSTREAAPRCTLAVQRAEQMSAPSAAIHADDELVALAATRSRRALRFPRAALMGSYRYEGARASRRRGSLKSVVTSATEEFKPLAEGKVLAEANCFVRDLQNKPETR